MINKALYTSNSDEWYTPQELFDNLNKEFNFDMDAAASDDHHLCPIYYTKETDGLKQEWGGIACFAIRRIAIYLHGLKRPSERRARIIQLL